MSGGGAAAATSSEIEFKVCIVPLRPGEKDTAGPIPHVVRIAPQSGTGKIPADAIIQEACAAANRTDAGHLNKGETHDQVGYELIAAEAADDNEQLYEWDISRALLTRPLFACEMGWCYKTKSGETKELPKIQRRHLNLLRIEFRKQIAKGDKFVLTDNEESRDQHSGHKFTVEKGEFKYSNENDSVLDPDGPCDLRKIFSRLPLPRKAKDSDFQLRVHQDLLEKPYTKIGGTYDLEHPLKELIDNSVAALLDDRHPNKTPKINCWETCTNDGKAGKWQTMDLNLCQKMDEIWSVWNKGRLAGCDDDHTYNTNDDDETSLTEVTFRLDAESAAPKPGDSSEYQTYHSIVIEQELPGESKTHVSLWVKRKPISRKVDIDIIVSGEDRALVISDNGPGMDEEGLKGMFDLAKKHAERGFDDDHPDQGDGVTLGLTGRLSHYGLGAKTATFQTGGKPHRGFIVRTRRRAGNVHEVIFSDKLIQDAVKDGKHWLKSPKHEELIPGKTGQIPDWLKEQPRIIKLLQSEEDAAKDDFGFTTMIVLDIKPDYIKQLKDRSENEGRIMCPDIKTGYQGMAESLAKCYHFFLHGANGKCDLTGRRKKRELSSWEQSGAVKLSPTDASVNEWKIGMVMKVWKGKDLKKTYDLANLVTEGNECDPVAARLQLSAQKVFRLQTITPHPEKEKGAVVANIMLSYIPVKSDGEKVDTFFDDPKTKRPFGPKSCSLFWEGRQLLPSEPFQLNIKALQETASKGAKITREQASRIVADVFVSRPVCGDETKQKVADDVGQLINKAIEDEEGSTIENETSVHYLFDRNGRRQTLSDALAGWVKICTEEDECIIATFKGVHGRVPTSVRFPPRISPYEVTAGVGEPLRLAYFHAHKLRCMQKSVKGYTTITFPHELLGSVRLVAGKANKIQRNLREPDGSEFLIRQISGEPVIVEKGTVVAFLHPPTGCSDVADDDNNGWKWLHIGKVEGIFPVSGSDTLPETGETPVQNVDVKIQIFPFGREAIGVDTSVQVSVSTICFAKPRGGSPDQDLINQWELLTLECKERRLVLRPLTGVLGTQIQDGNTDHRDLQKYAERELSRTDDLGKKIFEKKYPPGNFAFDKLVRIRQKFVHSRSSSTDTSKGPDSSTLTTSRYLKDAWNKDDFDRDGTLTNEEYTYTLEAIPLGEIEPHPLIAPINMKVKIHPGDPHKVTLEDQETKTVPIGEPTEIRLKISDKFENVIGFKGQPTLSMAAVASQGGLQCRSGPAQREKEVWIFPDVEVSFRDGVDPGDKRPKRVELLVNFRFDKLNDEFSIVETEESMTFKVKTCNGSPHHLVPITSTMEVTNFASGAIDVKVVDQYGWNPRKPKDGDGATQSEFEFNVNIGSVFGNESNDAWNSFSLPDVKRQGRLDGAIEMRLSFDSRQAQKHNMEFRSRRKGADRYTQMDIGVTVNPNPDRVVSVYFANIDEERLLNDKLEIFSGDDTRVLKLFVTYEDGSTQQFKGKPQLPDGSILQWTSKKLFKIVAGEYGEHEGSTTIKCPVTEVEMTCKVAVTVMAGAAARWHLELAVHAEYKCGERIKVTISALDKFGNTVYCDEPPIFDWKMSKKLKCQQIGPTKLQGKVKEIDFQITGEIASKPGIKLAVKKAKEVEKSNTVSITLCAGVFDHFTFEGRGLGVKRTTQKQGGLGAEHTQEVYPDQPQINSLWDRVSLRDNWGNLCVPEQATKVYVGINCNSEDKFKFPTFLKVDGGYLVFRRGAKKSTNLKATRAGFHQDYEICMEATIDTKPPIQNWFKLHSLSVPYVREIKLILDDADKSVVAGNSVLKTGTDFRAELTVAGDADADTLDVIVREHIVLVATSDAADFTDTEVEIQVQGKPGSVAGCKFEVLFKVVEQELDACTEAGKPICLQLVLNKNSETYQETIESAKMSISVRPGVPVGFAVHNGHDWCRMEKARTVSIGVLASQPWKFCEVDAYANLIDNASSTAVASLHVEKKSSIDLRNYFPEVYVGQHYSNESDDICYEWHPRTEITVMGVGESNKDGYPMTLSDGHQPRRFLPIHIQFTLESEKIAKLDIEIKKKKKELVEEFKNSPIYENYQSLLESEDNLGGRLDDACNCEIAEVEDEIRENEKLKQSAEERQAIKQAHDKIVERFETSEGLLKGLLWIRHDHGLDIDLNHLAQVVSAICCGRVKSILNASVVETQDAAAKEVLASKSAEMDQAMSVVVNAGEDAFSSFNEDREKEIISITGKIKKPDLQLICFSRDVCILATFAVADLNNDSAEWVSMAENFTARVFGDELVFKTLNAALSFRKNWIKRSMKNGAKHGLCPPMISLEGPCILSEQGFIQKLLSMPPLSQICSHIQKEDGAAEDEADEEEADEAIRNLLLTDTVEWEDIADIASYDEDDSSAFEPGDLDELKEKLATLQTLQIEFGVIVAVLEQKEDEVRLEKQPGSTRKKKKRKVDYQAGKGKGKRARSINGESSGGGSRQQQGDASKRRKVHSKQKAGRTSNSEAGPADEIE